MNNKKNNDGPIASSNFKNGSSDLSVKKNTNASNIVDDGSCNLLQALCPLALDAPTCSKPLGTGTNHSDTM